LEVYVTAAKRLSAVDTRIRLTLVPAGRPFRKARLIALASAFVGARDASAGAAATLSDSSAARVSTEAMRERVLAMAPIYHGPTQLARLPNRHDPPP